MRWEVLKDSYKDVLHNQLEEGYEITVNMYETLKSHGYNEEQAIEKLMPYLHELIVNVVKKEDKHDDAKWSDMIKDLAKDDMTNATVLDEKAADRLVKSIRKEFGIINNRQQEEYEQGLYAYETNLYVTSSNFGLNTKQVKSLVTCWVIMLYGLYSDKTYNFLNVCGEEYVEMAKVLMNYSNPYVNEKLAKELEKQLPEGKTINDKDVRKSHYTMSFRLLQKILDNIAYWTKKYGSNGYITYMEKYYTEASKKKK